MKFGAAIPQGPYGSTTTTRKISEYVDNNDRYDSLWVGDHLIVPDDPLQSHHQNSFEPLSLLSYVAAITNRVKLGTSCIVSPRRNPIILAKEIATLDNLSNGRVILGVGAGWSLEEAELLNADFSNRWELLDENVDLFRTIWKTEKATFTGKFFKISDGVFRPLPIQQGGPPIWISGNRKRTLNRVVKYADGWNPGYISPDEVAKGAAFIRSQTDRRIPISLRSKIVITSNPEGYKSGWGSPVDTIEGDERTVMNKLEQFREAGVNHLICTFGYVPCETILERMKTIERRIIPSFTD